MSVVSNTQTRRTFVVETAFAEGIGVVAGAAAGQVKAPTGAGQKCVGLAYTKGDPTDAKYAKASVTTRGEELAVSGGIVAQFARVKLDANGKVVAVGGEASGSQVEVVGIAMDAATAADQRIAVDFDPFVLTVP